MFRTFFIQTLGCKVNHYEAEQIAAFLRARGLQQRGHPIEADLRILHSCSVTCEAGSKSGQLTRRLARLPVLNPGGCDTSAPASTVVTGCWAQSNPREAESINGVAAVIGHGQDIAARLSEVLRQRAPGEPGIGGTAYRPGTFALPLLHERQPGQQRAFLKIQDGCDAFCTYCIIPRLRPGVWSKPIDECVLEAQRLVDAGHVEVVLTGIFLGAFGHATALRRRQAGGVVNPGLPALIDALCTRVRGLRRLRLSSLEPGDMTPELIGVLRAHPTVVPHFHLPLQSGSDAILRRMNRQYRRDDFKAMLDRVRAAFDRPALTTDVITGFPGETEADFDQTLELVDAAGFIHIHAFAFSPRPGTAAARWRDRFVPASIASERIRQLHARARGHSIAFRRWFVGEEVEILVERTRHPTIRHGRSERYFDVCVDDPSLKPGDAARVRIERVEADATFGTVLERSGDGA